MADELKRRVNDLFDRASAHGSEAVSEAEAHRRQGSGRGPGIIQVYVFAADAGERNAISVADALRLYRRADGRLHIRDTFTGDANGGREHVFDLPAGATHVQIFHRRTPQ